MSQKQVGTGANPFGSRQLVPSAGVPVVNVLPTYQGADKFIWGTAFNWGSFATVCFPLVIHNPTAVTSFRFIVNAAVRQYLENDYSGLSTLYRALVLFNDVGPTSTPYQRVPITWTDSEITVTSAISLLPGNYTFVIGFFNDGESLFTSTLSTYNGVNVPASDDPGAGIVGWQDAWSNNPGMFALTMT